MKYCIVGAGAIGGYVGARLALAGEEVTFIARGRNLEAIGAGGMKVFHGDGREEIASNVRATDSFESAGPADVVIIALKAHQLGAVCERLAPLFSKETVVIPMQNGIPFWYFHKHGGELAGRTLACVDPGGRIVRAIPPERVVGCVVYSAAELVSPGTVVHTGGERFPMGELDGSKSERIERICASFAAAGLQAPILDDIRAEVWVKLWGNVALNPVSALTQATMPGMCEDLYGRALIEQLMREAQAVAARLGIAFRVSLETRIEGAAKVGARHKTSMLQDVQAGRPLEADALVGSVVELGELAGVATPTIKAIYQAVKLLDRTMSAAMVSVRTVELPSS